MAMWACERDRSGGEPLDSESLDGEFPDSELPRERIITYGSDRASTVELIAVLLGTGTRRRPVLQAAQYLLHTVGGLVRLADTAPRELMRIEGIGMARATRIAAAFQLGRRALEETGPPTDATWSPARVYHRLGPRLRTLHQEVFVVLGLNAREVIIAESEVARGSLTFVDVHPREVFRPLIQQAAAAAVVAHNHPSGDPNPSPEDISLTHRLRAVGEIIGIPVLDHIIIGREGFVSMNEVLTL